MDSILIFIYLLYIIVAFSYTLEAFLNKDKCVEHWFLALLAIILCCLISWCYFPVDLGAKLYKKLNESKNT